MRKIFCYSKSARYIFLFLLLLSIIMASILCVLFKENGPIIFRIIWICIVIFCVLFSIFGFLHFSQYLYFVDGKIILQSPLYKIKELDINDCYYILCNLLSYYGRGYVSEKWICIYSNNENKLFKYGYTNGKKYKRIQVIYTEENYNYIQEYINKY